MGLFIHLFVNPNQISPGQWEKTYQESLWIFHKFPLPLMMVKQEERYGQKRWTYTRNLVQNEGSENEYWEICGDLLSKRQAESFRLYRNLTQQINFSAAGDDYVDSPAAWDDQDILWACPAEINYVTGNGFSAFHHKTQGYPYHLALLAVGILLENRFPHSVYVLGDIERYQIEMMVEWLNTLVETPVILPVCLDSRSLYQRLLALYQSPALAIARFKALYRGSREEQLAQLLQWADQAAVLAAFQKDLSRYRSLTQIGAQDLLTQFLAVTQDLKLLIALVQTIQVDEPESHEFTLEALLQVLCQSYITIDPQEREVLSVFARSADRLLTIQNAFAQTFMRLKGTPSAIEYYLEPSLLLALFSAYAPEKNANFANLIRESEADCRVSLQAIREKLSQQLQTTDDRDPSPAENPPTTATLLPDATLSPAAAYIVQQGDWQQEQFKEPEQSAQTMGCHVQELIQLYPEQFQSTDVNYYLTQICRASGTNGFALDETIWQQIEQVQTIEILQGILALASIPSRDSNFWHWRRYILEQPGLWPYLASTPTDI